MAAIRNVEEIRDGALAALAQASDRAALQEWRVRVLGRKGELTTVLRSLGSLPEAERRVVGAAANAARDVLDAAYTERAARVEQEELRQATERERVDVTLPGRPLPAGSLHVITRTLADVLDAFRSLGFWVAEGPEVEWDEYNFTRLRIPEDHPARDMFDTIWVDYTRPDGRRPMLLRTHTSPMQVRVMERRQPPIRVVVPGRCYRFEATDATHEWMFLQVEGLAVDEGVSLADLKGTLEEFARRIFGRERRVMLRHAYFPFVEPGVELAVDCFACHGTGCRVCGATGWIELLGAGMVHPEVLADVGYDARRYTGFAFGMGIERVALIRHGIDDIRMFYSNDVRFLEQFPGV